MIALGVTGIRRGEYLRWCDLTCRLQDALEAGWQFEQESVGSSYFLIKPDGQVAGEVPAFTGDLVEEWEKCFAEYGIPEQPPEKRNWNPVIGPKWHD